VHGTYPSTQWLVSDAHDSHKRSTSKALLRLQTESQRLH